MIRLNNFVIQSVAIHDIALLVSHKCEEKTSTVEDLQKEIYTTMKQVWESNDIPEKERIVLKLEGPSLDNLGIRADNVKSIVSQLHPKDQQAAKILQHKLNMIYAK